MLIKKNNKDVFYSQFIFKSMQVPIDMFMYFTLLSRDIKLASWSSQVQILQRGLIAYYSFFASNYESMQ